MSIAADILRDTVDHLSRCKLAKVSKARSTGTTIVLIDNRGGSYQQDGAPWYTLCLNHGLDCRHSTKAAGLAWMAEPEAWCQSCTASLHPTGPDEHPCDKCGAQVSELEYHGRDKPDGTSEYLCRDCPSDVPALVEDFNALDDSPSVHPRRET